MSIFNRFLGWTFALILAATTAGAVLDYVYVRNDGVSAVSNAMASAASWIRFKIDKVSPIAVLAIALAFVETIRGSRKVAHLVRMERRKRRPNGAHWKALKMAYCLILCALALVPGAYYGLHAIA